MSEVMNYIFKSLDMHDKTFKAIGNYVKHQNKVNVCLTVGMVLTTWYMYENEKKCIEQNKKIKALRKEIEELKEKTEE